MLWSEYGWSEYETNTSVMVRIRVGLDSSGQLVRRLQLDIAANVPKYKQSNYLICLPCYCMIHIATKNVMLQDKRHTYVTYLYRI